MDAALEDLPSRSSLGDDRIARSDYLKKRFDAAKQDKKKASKQTPRYPMTEETWKKIKGLLDSSLMENEKNLSKQKWINMVLKAVCSVGNDGWCLRIIL